MNQPTDVEAFAISLDQSLAFLLILIAAIAVGMVLALAGYAGIAGYAAFMRHKTL